MQIFADTNTKSTCSCPAPLQSRAIQLALLILESTRETLGHLNSPQTANDRFNSIIHNHTVTECTGRGVSAPASYSGDPGSNLGLETGYHGWSVSVVFLSHTTASSRILSNYNIKPRDATRFRASFIHLSGSQPISLRSILMLSTHLLLGLPCERFPRQMDRSILKIRSICLSVKLKKGVVGGVNRFSKAHWTSGHNVETR
jgi:hypothetical protein